MIKGIKMAGTLLTIVSVALIMATGAFVAGCAFTHDPRTIRIDNVGAKGLDSPQELTDSQKERIVELILNTPEAREPTQSVYRTWLMWTAIVWDNSHYSYKSSFDLEEVEADPEYQTVPESARWYPGATLYFGDPQAPTAEWLIQAHVDLDADKVVYISSRPYHAAPLTPPEPRK